MAPSHKPVPASGRSTPNFQFQAPHLAGEPLLSPTCALDAALGLARRVDPGYYQGTAPVHFEIVEPILAGTYVLISEQQAGGTSVPVGWLAYALFDAEAESRYVANPSQPLKPTDWFKGDRLWMLHWIALPGYGRQLLPVVQRLFAHLTARSLHRRGGHVTTWCGQGCSPQEAARFWRQRPVFQPAVRAVESPGNPEDQLAATMIGWLDVALSQANGSPVLRQASSRFQSI